ncbi:hypothetical protein LT493_45055 [Streptomyces tricolor]|nr:hypothetical protein [Streptomyces tricolor]
MIDSSGEPLRFAYDTEGRVTRWTDRNGTWFAYVYDDRGRVARAEGVDGILSGTLTYDDTARTTTYTDSVATPRSTGTTPRAWSWRRRTSWGTSPARSGTSTASVPWR